MRQTRRRGLGVLDTDFNRDATAGTNPEYPGKVLHGILWLQVTLNKLGFCVGAEDNIFGRQTTEGFRNYALTVGVSPEITSVDDRVLISQAASEKLQSEKLPKVGICVPADREAGVTEVRTSRAASSSSTSVPSTSSQTPTTITPRDEAGIPKWAWWTAGGILVLGLGAALYFGKKRR